MSQTFVIREASPEDYRALGDLTVHAYASLPGMPSPEEGAAYYAELRDVAGRAQAETNQILAAYDASSGALLGGVTLILEGYGRMWGVDGPAGIRMLAVDPAAQAGGVGRALVVECLDRARASGKQVVLLHTTTVMQAAQRLYVKFGFVRAPEMDFQYMRMTVMGYRLELKKT